MTKRILSLMLCFAMVMSTLLVVPATAATVYESTVLTVTASKTEVTPGDVIDFTVTMGPVSQLGSMQMVLDIPDGLTYVENSGRLADNLKANMGFDVVDYTEVSKMINGGALADYNSDSDTTLGHFQCTVDDDFTGASVGLTRLEFYSCETWIDHTERYSVAPAVLTLAGGSAVPEAPYSDYELRVVADKTEAVEGDTINFTVMMGPVQNLGSLQMVLDIPAGLTYVENSGRLVDGVKDAIGFDVMDYTEVSKMINGGALADYNSTEAVALGTFSCTVDAGFSGSASVGLTRLEFYSCETWDDYTALYFVTPAVITGPQPSTYDLTFVTDGSAVATVEDQAPGTVVDLAPYTTTKDGYRFMGWYADEARETPVTSVTLDADTTVYAKFVKEYTLTYYVDNVFDEEVVGTEGQVITLKSVPAKSGYDVLGWFVDDAGEAVTTVTLNSDVKVYAKYEYIPVQYTITFKVDGSDYGTFKVGEGRTVVLADAIENPTKAGYRFDGWALEGTKVTEVYGDGDKTLEAQFVKQYTLTITADGFATETQTVDVGTTIDLSTNIPEKEYWIFTGWTLDGSTVTSVTMDADKEVIASYVEAVAIVDDVEFATFDEAFAALADGSEMKLYKDLTTDTAIVVDDAATINLNGKTVTSTAAEAFEITDNATIKNGAIDADAIALSVEAAATVAVEDVDVKAATAIAVNAAANVTVDADSTVEATNALDFAAAGTVALNAPVNGTVIGAYNEDATITTTNEAVANAIDAEGYIVTKTGSVYNVDGIARVLTFVASDGSTVAPVRVVDGTVITLADHALTPADYTFAGWCSDDTLATVLNTITLDADKTVYAKFTTTLTFVANGGTELAAETFVKGTAADLTQYAPERSGYDFEGWYLDTYRTIPAGDSIVMDAHTTVYANWTAQAGLGEANVPYTIEAEARVNPDNGDKIFNAGETIYIDYTISSTAIDSLGSFQFDIDYDDTKLDFVTFEGALTAADGVLYTNNDTGRVSFDVDGGKGALDITGGKLVVTAVFTAKADVEGEALVGFDESKIYEVTPVGFDKNRADIILVEDTVIIKNIIITFKSGDNADFVPTDDDITAKVNYNVAGFIEVGFNVPADKLEAHDSFRLCEDTVAEPLWKVDGEETYYTSTEITQLLFTENVTFIAQVVDTCEITIVAGANGTVEGTTTFVVDAGTDLNEAALLDYVTPVPNPGYKFNGFVPAGVVTGDTTIEATFTDETYTLTNTIDTAIATVADGAGYVITTQAVTHGTDVVFTVTPVDEDANHIVEIGYEIDGIRTAITPDAATGEYTIPGDAIIGNVNIYAVVEGTNLVTFVAGDNGSIAGATYYVNDGEALTQEDIDDAKSKATPDPGYKYIGLAIDGSMVTEAELRTKALYADLDVTVIFDHETYYLTREDDTTVVEVTHGTDYTFTPELPGVIITDITGEYSDGTPVTVTKNPDGSYTIDGDDIIDDITLDAVTVDGRIRFILNRQYRALRGRTTDPGVKIAVLETAKLAGQKYAINDGYFMWSERYNAYVMVVDGLTENVGVTAAQIAAQLAVFDGDAEEVDYSGDMNSDGNITVNDAMIITDILHQKRQVPTSHKQMLMADCDDQTTVPVAEGEEKVTTKDVDFVRTTAQNN